MTNFIFNDGGRMNAGYKGETRDCVCRAIAIITRKPYKEVYDALNDLSETKKLGSRKIKTIYGTSYKKVSSSRTGVFKVTYDKYLKSLGYEWTPTMLVGQGCKVHLRSNELPSGRLIIRVSGHITSMTDGVLNDTYDCSRNGTRCVYGYYKSNITNNNL
jgi:hypothetical protein